MRQRRIDASEDSVRLALHALGALESPESDIRKALRMRKQERARQVVEPVIVAWNGELRGRNRHLPEQATLTLEDGTPSAWPTTNRLPHGYYKISVKESGRTHESLVISAPLKANFPLKHRGWGVFAPAYSLHSQRSFGAGDLTDLESVNDWMQNLGGKVLSTLPLLANYLEAPFEPSPYSPVSRNFWNEFYIDPMRAPEFATAQAAQLAASMPAKTKYVDYRGTMAAKRLILEALAKSFFSK